MHDSLFTAAPFYLFRASSWTKEKYEKILPHENQLLELFDSSPDLQQAIHLASPSLYASLKERPLKKPNHSLTSLYNYAVRMSTRATPFGLFSFVASGVWGEKTSANFDSKYLKKHARADMEWLWNVIYKKYHSNTFTSCLPVKAHPLITFQGDRAYLDYRYFASHEKPLKPVSISATKLVRAILSLTSDALSFDELWQILKSPDLDKEKTFELVKRLLQEQFLLPGDIPSLLSLSPHSDASRHIPAHVSYAIDQYSNGPYEQVKELLCSLQDEMRAMAPSRNMLQVDMAYTKSTFQLSNCVKQELERAMSVWWKISTSIKPESPLKRYLEQFLEKYGTYRTVPLLELLSNDKGLGSFEHPLRPSESKFAVLWYKWLQQQWQDCIKTNRDEIVLTEQILDELFTLSQTTAPDPKNAMNSFELFCHVLAESEELIDKEEFLVHFADLTWQAASAFGRFLPLFGDELRESLKKFYKQEEQLDPEVMYVMQSYWPASVRYANVASQPHLSDLKLDLFGNNDSSALKLTDIYVGATQNRFYLTVKEGGREIILRSGNMLNPKSAPLALQFMRLVTVERKNKLFPFALPGSLQDVSYMPRLRLHKTVLAPAKWRFDATLESHECIEKLFLEWADKWHLPTQCNLIQEDQLLLIDRNNPICLQEIIQKIKAGQMLEFSEVLQSYWATSEKGHHFTEIVVPFLKNSIHAKSDDSIITLPYQSISPELRWKLLGSQWLSIKFYLPDDKQDLFLLQQITRLIKTINIHHWFFVRYNDPESHIRFRIKLSSLHDLAQMLSCIESSSLSWLQNGTIKNIVFSPYEREIERYGGPELIDLVEELFCIDSSSVLSCLHLPVEKPVLRALSVVSFLQDAGFTLDQKRVLLHYPDEHLEGFRQYKSQLFSLVKQLQPTAERVTSLEKIRACCEKLSIWQRFAVYKSLLHMHCNRLGCSGSEEKQACKYAEKILFSQDKRFAFRL